jgi:hypothetical protein
MSCKIKSKLPAVKFEREICILLLMRQAKKDIIWLTRPPVKVQNNEIYMNNLCGETKLMCNGNA